MTYGTLGGYGRRRRAAAMRRVVNLFLSCLLGAIAAGYAYQIGVSTAVAKTEKLEANLTRFQENDLRLRDQLADVSMQFRETSERLAALEVRYAEEVPVGEVATLMRQVRRQLTQGVDSERLGLLIRSAARSVPCETLPETRRFVVQTPIGAGPRSTIRFADNRINVWASGLSARALDSSPEAWFDPAEPVHIVFEALGGDRETVDGKLPLTHRMVLDGHEYRFSLTAGARSFIEVTGQACALPGSRHASG